MKYINVIPACHSYLKDDLQRLQILLSLAEQGCKERYPDIMVSREQLLTLFHGAGIIKEGTSLSGMETPLNADCFSIVSEYKCSYICQICPLSGRYKNAREAEESTLLSYALATPENFKWLKESGVDSTMFQSLFLINPVPSGSLVPTLPLNRLVYFYLECTANTLHSFTSLPADITAAIERDNQKKLTKNNVTAINQYLKQLRKNDRGDSERVIAGILRDVYKLNPKMTPSTVRIKEPHPPEDPIQQSEKKELNPPTDEVSKKPEKITTNEKRGLEEKVNEFKTHPTEVSCLEGLLTQKVKAESPKAQPVLPQIPALYIKKKPPQVKEVLPEPEPPTAGKKETLFLPSCFSKDDNGGYPVIMLSMYNAIDQEAFLSFLLNHPKLALEVITDAKTGEECLLFFGSQLFYLIKCSDPGAVDVLSQFLAKSSIRNQICLDPYRLYNYLSKHRLPVQNVFSLRAAYTALTKMQNRSHLRTINEMITELVSRTNHHGLPAHIFCMPYYLKMQEVITQNHVFCQKETQDLFLNISSINTLLGISYELQESVAAPSCNTLFELDENLNYSFHYIKDSMDMKTGIYSVTYTFSHSQPSNNIAMDLLYRFARKELMTKFSYRLLAFQHDSFTIATKEDDYSHLCEIVANMATHIATNKGLLPIYVSEERITS